MFTHSQVSSFTEALKHVVETQWQENTIQLRSVPSCASSLSHRELGFGSKSQHSLARALPRFTITTSTKAGEPTFFQDPRITPKNLDASLPRNLQKPQHKEAVARTIKMVRQYPRNTCNEHVYSLVCRYALSKYSKSLSIISAPSGQLSTCNERSYSYNVQSKQRRIDYYLTMNQIIV
ncbi:Hypothetical_protein [Hexamita inflata]|uniref:Hypothetical_protein n=1 Tax=Hexamita inflata TaxID=28002 RepID=A0AA86QU38_9EUKA|nr:Hypothetical protein HINF_LOCUS52385 [Hexamita inflata]